MKKVIIILAVILGSILLIYLMLPLLQVISWIILVGIIGAGIFFIAKTVLSMMNRRDEYDNE